MKNLSAMQETWVLSVGQEDPLEKGMAIYFSILAWRIPWILVQRSLVGYGPWSHKRDTTEQLNTTTTTTNNIPTKC